MQVVALGAGHAHGIALNAGLHFQFAVLDDAHDLLGVFGFNAVLDLDDLLDLVAADFFDLAAVEKTHVHIAFGHLVGQDVAHLVQLELGVGIGSQVALFQFDAGVAALEVEAGADFFIGLIKGILDFDQIGLGDGIK